MSSSKQFLDSSPSKDFYTDDSEMISLLNSMWGSNQNPNPNQYQNNQTQLQNLHQNQLHSQQPTSKTTDYLVRRSTSSSFGFPIDLYSRQTPLKSIPPSRQPSIPTLPIHHFNQQQQQQQQKYQQQTVSHDNQLIYMDSPNFDSFITFTPNQIQPSNKLFSNQKQNQSKCIVPNQQNMNHSKSQILQAQHFPFENLVSPNFRTPMANRSHNEDLFDTPYLNNLYTTFANTTNNDDQIHSNGNNNLVGSQNLLKTDLITVQTPFTEKLEKIFKTPTSNDIFNSKQFFGNSTIKRLINSNSTKTINISLNNTTTNNNVTANISNPAISDFGNFKNSPCVKHKQYELIQKEKLLENQIKNLQETQPSFRDTSSSTFLNTVREAVDSHEFFTAENHTNPNIVDIMSSDVKTPQKKSKKSKSTNKKGKKKNKTSSSKSNLSPSFTCNKSRKLKETSILSNSTMMTNPNVDINANENGIEEKKKKEKDYHNEDENNDIIINSSPSTIVVSSASRSGNRLAVLPNTQILEASPTPMNKYINNVLSIDNDGHPSQLSNIQHGGKLHNDNSDNSNNPMFIRSFDRNIKPPLHSYINSSVNIHDQNQHYNQSSNNNRYDYDGSSNTPNINNTSINDIPKAPAMGVFKEHSNKNTNKSLKKYNTQPAIPYNSSNKPSFSANNKKFNRSTSLNDNFDSKLKPGSNKNDDNGGVKNLKRTRGNSGKIHFIMADPDQLKGNKKRRISRKKIPEIGSTIPLGNSTNVVNNRTKTPSPIKGKSNSSLINKNRLKTGISTDKNENNIFWEPR